MYSILASSFFALSFFYVVASDKSPDEYLCRLRVLEQNQKVKKNNRFKFHDSCLLTEDGKSGFRAIQKFMKKYNCQDYLGYLAELASSPYIGDAEKLQGPLILIPPIEQLKKKDQQTKDEVLRDCFHAMQFVNYPIARPLLAAIYSIRPNLNQVNEGCVNYLIVHLRMDDIPMISRALDFGADPNTCQALDECTSVRATQLLLDPARKHQLNLQTKDCAQAIEKLCCSFSQNGMLQYLLQRVELDQTNEFGKQWMDAVNRLINVLGQKILLQRVELLLKHGCHYDEQTKKILFSTINRHYEERCNISYGTRRLGAWEKYCITSERDDLKAKLTELFERYASANVDTELSLNFELF